ncbi:MAG TPA: hypothetical protein DEO84_01330 [candidate division Zixibacteria bacterium]|jgi:hypothetical protein|nr:hypothetical protein [candidate division Zixibacteria bacterium]
MKIWSLLFTVLIFSSASATDRGYSIKYISGESVYLDAGTNDSLVIGDRLRIVTGDSISAELEIVFVADNSSSCKILSQTIPPKVGDKAIISTAAPRQMQETANPPAETSAVAVIVPPVASTAPAKSSKTRLDGSVSFQLYRWDDLKSSNLDFTQPGIRFNLKARQIYGSNFSLFARTTSRHNQRTRSYNRDVPKSDWRNRIYQLAVVYADDKAPFYFELGRIIFNNLSGVGYIDGILVQKSLSAKFNIGGFGGTQPEWQYSDFQTSIQKYGVYLGYANGDLKKYRLESTLALTGEYHGSTVSREFVFLRNTLNLSNRWNFFQSSEVDINRGWRKEKSGKSLSITNLFVFGRGRLGKYLSAGLSIDNRKNYWTYELKSLADSLFDDILRRGLRVDLSIKPGKGYFISPNFGYNKRSGDGRATISYGISMNKSNFISSSQYANLQFSGFTGPFTDGYNYSFRLGRYFRSNMLSLGYGAYIYQFNSGGNHNNQWIQASGQFNLISNVYISTTYEYDSGDDIKGHRIYGELGYRF